MSPFEEWYDRDWDALVVFAIRLGAGQEHAKDLVQNACAEVWKRWAAICHPSSYARKSIGRAYWMSVSNVERQSAYGVPEDLPAPEDPSIGEIEFKDQEQMIFAVIRDLPPRQREVIAWSIDGYQPNEIAGEIGITAEAVRKSLCDARKALRKRLLELGGGDGV